MKFNFTRGSSTARVSSASGAGLTTDTGSIATVGSVMSSAVNDIPGLMSASMLRSKNSR